MPINKAPIKLNTNRSNIDDSGNRKVRITVNKSKINTEMENKIE